MHLLIVINDLTLIKLILIFFYYDRNIKIIHTSSKNHIHLVLNQTTKDYLFDYLSFKNFIKVVGFVEIQ